MPPSLARLLRRLLDAPLGLGLLVAFPVIEWRARRRGRPRHDPAGRLGGGATLPAPAPTTPRILLHAVSVGEVNAIRGLVRTLGAKGAEVVVASTTDTGLARARTLFEGGDAAMRATVVRWPLDLAFAVERFLDRVRPDAVGLVELEVWPGFTAAARDRRIPVAVVNGRLSARSFSRYRRMARLVRPSFRRLARVLVQDRDYAARFAALGVPEDRIEVTDTMKWDAVDSAAAARGPSREAAAFAAAFGIDAVRAAGPLVVAGSTAPEEVALLRDALPPAARLLVAPRRPEWFDAAAAELPGCVRRSRGDRADAATRHLVLDTIGELRHAYELADLVVTGRSFDASLGRHGSDMMEPAALGKAVITGPAVDDFRSTVDALVAGGGLVVCPSEALAATLARLLASDEERRRVAEAAATVIRSRQGATSRTATVLLELVGMRRTETQGS